MHKRPTWLVEATGLAGFELGRRNYSLAACQKANGRSVPERSCGVLAVGLAVPVRRLVLDHFCLDP
jgi:hypothetical protein